MLNKKLKCVLIETEYVHCTEARENRREYVTEPYQENGCFVIPEEDGWARLIRPAQFILHLEYDSEIIRIHIEGKLAGNWGGIPVERAASLFATQPDDIMIVINENGFNVAQSDLTKWIMAADIWYAGHTNT